MSTFDAALERIKDYLWKPVTITDGDGDNLDALFFNIKEILLHQIFVSEEFINRQL